MRGVATACSREWVARGITRPWPKQKFAPEQPRQNRHDWNVTAAFAERLMLRKLRIIRDRHSLTSTDGAPDVSRICARRDCSKHRPASSDAGCVCPTNLPADVVQANPRRLGTSVHAVRWQRDESCGSDAVLQVGHGRRVRNKAGLPTHSPNKLGSECLGRAAWSRKTRALLRVGPWSSEGDLVKIKGSTAPPGAICWDPRSLVPCGRHHLPHC